jgi:hypothetical protein
MPDRTKRMMILQLSQAYSDPPHPRASRSVTIPGIKNNKPSRSIDCILRFKPKSPDGGLLVGKQKRITNNVTNPKGRLI